jgi:hypothetical protein
MYPELSGHPAFHSTVLIILGRNSVTTRWKKSSTSATAERERTLAALIGRGWRRRE